MKQGEPIWVESLLTPQEWKELKNKYSTYSTDKPTPFFAGEFYWRWRMGEYLKEEEEKLINQRIDAVLKKVKNEQ
jgi:hypothetical protein